MKSGQTTNEFYGPRQSPKERFEGNWGREEDWHNRHGTLQDRRVGMRQKRGDEDFGPYRSTYNQALANMKRQKQTGRIPGIPKNRGGEIWHDRASWLKHRQEMLKNRQEVDKMYEDFQRRQLSDPLIEGEHPEYRPGRRQYEV